MGRPRTANKHLPKYVTVIHGSYWYRPPDKEPVRIGLVKDGEAQVWRHQLTLNEPVKEMRTLADIFDRYERDVLPTLAPRTQIDYRRHLITLRKFCGHMHPDELKPRDIGRFLDVPTGKIQRNRQVAVLSAVYTKAVGRWYVADRNPCNSVERNDQKKRTRYITDAEYKAVYAYMPPKMQIAMELALLTGQRQGDLLSLSWAQVTEEGILFTQSKTGKRLRVGLSPRLEAALVRAKGMLPHLPRRYVLRNEEGAPYCAAGFRAIWQRHMRTALRGNKRRPAVLKERFTFHDLRAKSVSDSKSLQDAMDRAGHTSMAMTRGVYDRGIRDVKPLA